MLTARLFCSVLLLSYYLLSIYVDCGCGHGLVILTLRMEHMLHSEWIFHQIYNHQQQKRRE